MEIQDIKSSLSIQTVLTHYGLSPDKNNRLCCPWHNDKTPSLQIYPKTNAWTCFSSNCTAGSGDTIEMIQRMDNSSKHEAILKAKSMLNPVEVEKLHMAGGHATISKSKLTTMSQNQSQDLIEIPTPSLVEVFNSQRKSLHRTKKALQYLKDRNLDPLKSELGFNSYQSGYKQLQNCISFPLKDSDNNIVSLYGRSVADKKGGNHYYSKNRRGLYPGYPIAETKILIVTEAIIDAATLINYLPQLMAEIQWSVLSLFGAKVFNEEHTEALRNLPQLAEVIFFVDGDEAGDQCIDIYGKLVKAMKPGIKISKVNTPEGEDINSLVQSHEPEILAHLIENRIILFSSDPRSELKEKEIPHSPSSDLDVSNQEYIKWSRSGLDFTIIGGVGLYPLDRLKVTLRIKRKDSERPIHSLRQTIDLYQDDLIEKLSRKIAERLEIGSSKVHESLLELTGLLEQYREIQNEKRKAKKVKIRELTPQRIETAQAFLTAPKLHDRTNAFIGKTGMIGEEKNRMILWYVYTSRLRKQPLHVMCLGASGTGKTYLQERIGALIPEHHKKEITAMSDNAMYYFAEKELVNKLLLIEDLDGANEQKILYALRELMSKTYISKTIVIKDSKGNLRTITLHVRGPICLAGTTTRERLYEDNSNRSLLLYLDNSKAQRERIMDYQRRKSAGLIDFVEQEEAIEFLKDIQQVLKPIRVVNPYATELILPEEVFKPLRTNDHYIQFIETVTFYHQYQREVKTDKHGRRYITTTIEDIEIANELMKDVLLAKSDELTKACRDFFERIKKYLAQEKRDSFYRYHIRESFRMNPNNVRYYLTQLSKYGYIKIVGGNKHRSGYEYEITRKEEYSKLNNSIENALDQALQRIKSKLKGGEKSSGSDDNADNS